MKEFTKLDFLRDENALLKQDINQLSSNKMGDMDLDAFIFNRVMQKVDPIYYIENTLRAHLPEKKRHLHENQIELVKAVCNPSIRRVAALMARQCIVEGSIIHTIDGKLIPIERHSNAWLTNEQAKVLEIKVKGGHIIKCTANHPIMTKNGWKKAGLLTKEDLICCLDSWNKFNDKEVYTTEQVIELSQYLFNNGKKVDVSQMPFMLNDFTKEQARQFFDGYAEIYAQDNTTLQVYCGLLDKLGRNYIVDRLNIIMIDTGKKETFKGEDGENLYYAPIIEINQLEGTYRVWDVEYPNKGWFICGGIKVHNSGKCFAPGTLIMMSNGTSKKIEDIKIGDYVMSPDSKPIEVVALGCGEEEMYEIQTFDNHNFTVNKPHILSLLKNDKKVNITVEDFIKLPIEEQRLYKGYRVNALNKKPTSYSFDFKIISKGIGKYYGFVINSEEHLFLLDDCTVVHNTESIASFVGYLLDNYPQMRIGIFTPRIQQAEINVGRTAVFYQRNEDKLNNKLIKCTKDKIELSNGSFVSAVSGSDQSNIEGLTFDIIILDEAQKISDYTWSERISPMGL